MFVLNLCRYINGTRLDDRIIRTDWDAGFKEGRQYGRGKSGGQVRDEYRTDYDIGRGGYGKIVNQRMGPDIQQNLMDTNATGIKAGTAVTPTAAATPAPTAEAPTSTPVEAPSTTSTAESEPTPMAT